MANEERPVPEINVAAEQSETPSETPVEPEMPPEAGEKIQEVSPDAAATEDLQRRLEDACNKADEHWNELLRARAEMENQRRRHERELEKAHKYALEKFAQELLPVKDSLEMGLTAAQAEDADVEALREGTELILRVFNEAVTRFGIKEVDPQDDLFNPEFHQAISTQESNERPPDTVLTVVRKGYLLNDRLLRPAMVVVSKSGFNEEIPPEADPET